MPMTAAMYANPCQGLKSIATVRNSTSSRQRSGWASNVSAFQRTRGSGSSPCMLKSNPAPA